jgi:hypothetical protein
MIWSLVDFRIELAAIIKSAEWESQNLCRAESREDVTNNETEVTG